MCYLHQFDTVWIMEEAPRHSGVAEGRGGGAEGDICPRAQGAEIDER